LDAIRKSSKKHKMIDQLTSIEFMAACKDDAFKISSYCVCAAPAKAAVSCSMRPIKEWPRAATRANSSQIDEAKAQRKRRTEEGSA
jgi:hypothetical protein